MTGRDAMREPTGVLFCGVGGQGILLASEILADTALAAGLDVKKSEVHGMAQRGGSVTSHVRFGRRVWSPLIPDGEVDFLVAFEELEGLRYIHLLRRGGTVILNRQRILTLGMLTGDVAYPEAELDTLPGLPLTLAELDAPALAREAGNARSVNLAVVGALAAHLSFAEDAWRAVIEKRVPARFMEANWKAFLLGRRVVAGKENA